MRILVDGWDACWNVDAGLVTEIEIFFQKS